MQGKTKPKSRKSLMHNANPLKKNWLEKMAIQMVRINLYIRNHKAKELTLVLDQRSFNA